MAEVDKTTYNPLTPEESYVIERKGTERPFSGEYDNFYEPGVYICRRCNAELYRSDTKFNASVRLAFLRSGGISGAVNRQPDPDGMRIDDRVRQLRRPPWAVFVGEHLTSNNTRHCINSLSDEVRGVVLARPCI